MKGQSSKTQMFLPYGIYDAIHLRKNILENASSFSLVVNREAKYMENAKSVEQDVLEIKS